MTKRSKILLTTAVFAALSFSSSVWAGSYSVIVNANNAASGESNMDQVKNLFLKKQSAWNDGTKALPLARNDSSPEQRAFVNKVLGMGDAEVVQYFAAEKSKSGMTPPRAIGSDGLLFRQIARKPGAFGVVAAGTDLPDTVKVLFSFSD